MSNSPVADPRYTPDWLEECATAATSAAGQIVPAVLRLVPLCSVLDIGCGLGALLRGFQRCAVSEVFGVDGPWVPAAQLLIDARSFSVRDLASPVDLDRSFDMAACLEVAEHLPEACADVLLDSLARHSDIILFSAAIPLQGGQNHLNEQWPSWWAERWGKRGYVPVDIVRDALWADDSVAAYYRQNLLLFVNDDGLSRNPQLRSGVQPVLRALDRVRPVMWLSRASLAAEAVHRLGMIQRVISA